MVNSSPESIVNAVMQFYGYSFSQRFHINLEENSSGELFKLLVASFLFSTCVDWEAMVRAYGEFDRRRWLEAENLARSSYDDRLRALSKSGYERDAKDIALTIGDLPVAVMERYNGRLALLRERAGNDPENERRLLEDFKGIGAVSSDLFFQEIQLVWDEWYPFAGKMALRGAREILLAQDARVLTEVVAKKDFPRFTASLLQMEHDSAASRVLAEAEKLESLVTMPL